MSDTFSIRVRDPVNFGVMAILDTGWQSLSYVTRYRDSGQFNISVGAEHPLIERIKQRNAMIEIVRNGVTVFTGRTRTRHIVADSNEESGEVWELSGPDLTPRKKRALPAPLTTNDASTQAGGDFDVVTGITVAQALQYYIDVNMITPNEPDRIVPYMRLGKVLRPPRQSSPTGIPFPMEEVQVNDTDEMVIITWKARFDNMTQILQDIATAGNAGFQFRFDPTDRLVYFDTLLQVDRSENSTSGYRKAIFSFERQNVKSIEYLDDAMDIENTIYFLGDGSATTRLVVIFKTGPNAGLMYDSTNANPLGSPNIVPSSIAVWERQEGVLNYQRFASAVDLADAFQAYLNEHSEKQSVTFQPHSLPRSDEWGLGDIVTVKRPKWGLVANDLISEITVTVDNDMAEPEVQVTVGSSVVERFAQFVTEINRSAFYSRSY